MSYVKLPEIFGEPVFISVPAPAAGSPWTYTPDARMIIRPLFIKCLFAASGAAADRYFRLEYNFPGPALAFVCPALVIQTASQTIRYNVSPGGYDPAPISTNHSFHLAPAFFTDTDSISGQVTGIQVGDAFTEIYIHALKWRV